AAAAAITVAVSAAAAAGAGCGPLGCAPALTGADPVKISLTGVDVGQVVVALLAALAVGGEYGTGTIRVSLAATPRRLVTLADHVLARHLVQVAPMTAGLYIQVTAGLRSLPLAPWQGLGVLALWALGALIAGAVVLRLRDA